MSPVVLFWSVLLAVVVANQFVIGMFCEYLAYEKNRDGALWFWLGFLLGPMPIALLTLIGLPVVSADEADHRQSRRLAAFESLRKISVQEAKILSQRKGPLTLTRLSSLSEEVAEALALHEDHLYLNGLRALSDEAAKALAKHKGGLGLWGLNTLSDEVAMALSRHKGPLDLGGLRMVSAESARAFAHHDGDLHLGGLTTLSDEAAKALRVNPNIRLPDKFRR